MIATIHQPQYLPWLGYFDKADKADIFILLDNVQFKKNDWQNRNKIKTSQGEQWLTVPIIHNFGQRINDVAINNNVDWRDDHLKAIKLNYAKAKYYDKYIKFFESVYSREWNYLVELNVFLVKELIELLGITTKIILSSEYNVTEDSTQRLVELCKEVGADMYISGKDGKNYMDFTKFAKNNIKIIEQDYRHPVYKQLWHDKDDAKFISNLSVIDLLFNHGDESLKIIRGENVKYEDFN